MTRYVVVKCTHCGFSVQVNGILRTPGYCPDCKSNIENEIDTTLYEIRLKELNELKQRSNNYKKFRGYKAYMVFHG